MSIHLSHTRTHTRHPTPNADEACHRVHETAKPGSFEGCTARAQRCVFMGRIGLYMISILMQRSHALSLPPHHPHHNTPNALHHNHTQQQDGPAPQADRGLPSPRTARRGCPRAAATARYGFVGVRVDGRTVNRIPSVPLQYYPTNPVPSQACWRRATGPSTPASRNPYGHCRSCWTPSTRSAPRRGGGAYVQTYVYVYKYCLRAIPQSRSPPPNTHTQQAPLPRGGHPRALLRADSRPALCPGLAPPRAGFNLLTYLLI